MVSWTDVVVAIAAFWGMVTGTGALVIQWYIATRPKLVVSLSSEAVSFVPTEDEDPEDYPSPPEDVVYLDIINSSQRRIKVETVSIEWDDQSVFWSDLEPDSGKTLVPKNVPAYDHICFGVAAEDFKSGLHDHGARGRVYVRAAARDATHKLYRSQKLALDV